MNSGGSNVGTGGPGVMATWMPLLVAITAAVVALVGYWLTYRSKRLEAKAKAYADALSAIEAYKSLPYRITRRSKKEDPTKEDPEEYADLRRLVGEVQQSVAFYRRWLALESTIVGLAFEALANKVMSYGAIYRRRAWTNDPDSAAAESGYEYFDNVEQGACLAAMRRDLGRRQRNPAKGAVNSLGKQSITGAADQRLQ